MPSARVYSPRITRGARGESVWRVVRRRAVRMLLVSFAVLAGATAVSYAASAGAGKASATVIQACEGPNGLLRVVHSQNDCRHNEDPISWNIAGPAGPAGPAGATGPAGDPRDRQARRD